MLTLFCLAYSLGSLFCSNEPFWSLATASALEEVYSHSLQPDKADVGAEVALQYSVSSPAAPVALVVALGKPVTAPRHLREVLLYDHHFGADEPGRNSRKSRHPPAKAAADVASVEQKKKYAGAVKYVLRASSNESGDGPPHAQAQRCYCWY